MERLPAFDRPIAHRGLHDRQNGIIENSIPAFEAAVEHGFAMECDVHVSGDGKPIVFHDDDLERLTGQKGAISMLSAGQACRIPLLDSAAGACPPRFETLLETIAGRQLLVVELKHQFSETATHDLARSVTAALAGYKGPVVVESFDPKLLTAMHAAGFDGALGIILTRNAQRTKGLNGFFSEMILRHMLHYPMTRFSFMSVNRTDLDLPLVRFWRSRGLPVTAWTIRSDDEARAARQHADQIVFEGYLPIGA